MITNESKLKFVRDWLKEKGKIPRSERIIKMIAFFDEDFENGMADTDIARNYKVSNNAMYYWLSTIAELNGRPSENYYKQRPDRVNAKKVKKFTKASNSEVSEVSYSSMVETTINSEKFESWLERAIETLEKHRNKIAQALERKK